MLLMLIVSALLFSCLLHYIAYKNARIYLLQNFLLKSQPAKKHYGWHASFNIKEPTAAASDCGKHSLLLGVLEQVETWCSFPSIV